MEEEQKALEFFNNNNGNNNNNNNVNNDSPLPPGTPAHLRQQYKRKVRKDVLLANFDESLNNNNNNNNNNNYNGNHDGLNVNNNILNMQQSPQKRSHLPPKTPIDKKNINGKDNNRFNVRQSGLNNSLIQAPTVNRNLRQNKFHTPPASNIRQRGSNNNNNNYNNNSNNNSNSFVQHDSFLSNNGNGNDNNNSSVLNKSVDYQDRLQCSFYIPNTPPKSFIFSSNRSKSNKRKSKIGNKGKNNKKRHSVSTSLSRDISNSATTIRTSKKLTSSRRQSFAGTGLSYQMKNKALNSEETDSDGKSPRVFFFFYVILKLSLCWKTTKTKTLSDGE